MRSFLILVFSTFLFQTASAHVPCKTLLVAADAERQSQEAMSCLSSECSPQRLSVAVVKNVEKILPPTLGFLKAKRGYAILIGTMVGSAALTSFLTTHLPPQLGFFSQLLGQLSTLGVYVFGSPIWEPISSGFRKFAFGVSQVPAEPLQTNTQTQGLESTWLRTQENYSLNAQMSRNVINLFIGSTRQNFYEAYRAMHTTNKRYAADQIAEAAIRMRLLFKDVQADDPSVSLAVRAAFSTQLIEPQIADLVRERIEEHDSEYKNETVRTYYARLLAAWFLNNEKEQKI